MTPDEPKRENPAELSLDGVSEGIGALPKRIDRYGKAKNGALDVVDYMETLPPVSYTHLTLPTSDLV